MDQAWHEVMWKNIMDRVHEGLEYKEFSMPTSVEQKTICTQTGLLATSSCPPLTEYFAKGTAPSQSCPGHVVQKEEKEEDDKDKKKDEDKKTEDPEKPSEGDGEGGGTVTPPEGGGNEGGGNEGGGNQGGGEGGGGSEIPDQGGGETPPA